MIPRIRVFAKAGVEAVYGGGYDRDQMFYEIRDIDFYDEDVTVWGCHRKDCGMCDDTYRFEDVEIMMSTGIKDKNGVDIFEHSELDGAYEVIFKDLKYKLRYIPNNDIIDLHDYWRDKNGEIEVTREYTKV